MNERVNYAKAQNGRRCFSQKKKRKGKKIIKIWYARIQFCDDAGKRKQVVRKPAYNSPTPVQFMFSNAVHGAEGPAENRHRNC